MGNNTKLAVSFVHTGITFYMNEAKPIMNLLMYL